MLKNIVPTLLLAFSASSVNAEVIYLTGRHYDGYYSGNTFHITTPVTPGIFALDEHGFSQVADSAYRRIAYDPMGNALFATGMLNSSGQYVFTGNIVKYRVSDFSVVDSDFGIGGPGCSRIDDIDVNGNGLLVSLCNYGNYSSSYDQASVYSTLTGTYQGGVSGRYYDVAISNKRVYLSGLKQLYRTDAWPPRVLEQPYTHSLVGNTIPAFIDVDRFGYLYAYDPNDKAVYKYDPDGYFVSVLAAGFSVVDMQVENDFLYVLGNSSPGAETITKFSLDGTLQSETLLSGYYSGIAVVPTPIPASLWLFASGLLGILGWRSHRRPHPQ